MSDHPVRTIVETRSGPLDFQTWFVKRRTRDRVVNVKFQGAAQSRPAPGILDAIRLASAIIFCPSNPIISIGPILAVPGIRTAIEQRRSKSIAISPIVAGRALKGPAARMMRSMGMEPAARGVAEHYRGLIDVFVLDHEDAKLAPAIEQFGMRPVVTNTIMTGAPQKKALARAVLNSLEET
jgi:LPPG:FO 2-phospho-L-lactate transferase